MQTRSKSRKRKTAKTKFSALNKKETQPRSKRETPYKSRTKKEGKGVKDTEEDNVCLICHEKVPPLLIETEGIDSIFKIQDSISFSLNNNNYYTKMESSQVQ